MLLFRLVKIELGMPTMFASWEQQHVIKGSVGGMDVGDTLHGSVGGNSVSEDDITTVTCRTIARKNDSYFFCSGEIVATVIIAWQDTKANFSIWYAITKLLQNFERLLVNGGVGMGSG
jgi:hypothetical protein